MKKKFIIYITFAVSMFAYHSSLSQTMNWERLQPDQRHVININAGAEYGLVAGAAYAYRLKTKMPLLLNFEYTVPSGQDLSDDFKTRIGGYIRLYQAGHFHFSAKLQGVFRRYENSFARLTNFGSDMAAIAGYYRSKWFVAGEAGFDKAIVTHFKHSAAYKDIFPGVKDGWYEPATGGNFYYGLQAGFSFGRSDIYLKGGKVQTQDFSTTPLLPYYLQLGYNIRF